jgi:hypothetical protein
VGQKRSGSGNERNGGNDQAWHRLLSNNAGIDNLLVFTEDYRITGDSLQEMMFFHVDAGKLQSVLEHMREGQTVEGDSLISWVQGLNPRGAKTFRIWK